MLDNGNSTAKSDVLWFLILSLVLLSCAMSLRAYYLAGLPPMWDNLAYQNDGLRLFRLWLDGQWAEAASAVFDSRAPGHALFLAASFLVFGLSPSSPYVVSALFGFGGIVATYFLAQELGASRRVAFWGALAFALLPNFIYQNFLQTRNDYEAAFFNALSWIFLLRAIKQNKSNYVVVAGLSAGLGTLFKVSLPGYVIWGMLSYLFLPWLSAKRYPFYRRLRHCIYFALGAVLACGWYYFPKFQDIISYYRAWGDMDAFQSAQYALATTSDRYLFYLRNLGGTHLSGLFPVIFAGLCLLAAKRILSPPCDAEAWGGIWASAKEQGYFLVLFAAALPIGFITYRGTLASVGDIPVLPMLAAILIAMFSFLVSGYEAGKRIIAILMVSAPIAAILSLANLPIAERQYSALDFQKFSSELLEFCNKYGVRKGMMQVYSHPIYNVTAAYWSWMIDPHFRGSVTQFADMTKLIHPEEPKAIAGKLDHYPMLIISDQPGTAVGGERFHTLNRFHKEINDLLEEGGHFVKMQTISTEKDRFLVHVALNKDYVVFRPAQVTPDNWVEWNSRVEYFALSPARLRWVGVPIRPIDKFWLRSIDNRGPVLTMTLNQVLPNGQYEYLSKNEIPAVSELTAYVLDAPDKLTEHASAEDRRKLAFYGVESNAFTIR